MPGNRDNLGISASKMNVPESWFWEAHEKHKNRSFSTHQKLWESVQYSQSYSGLKFGPNGFRFPYEIYKTLLWRKSKKVSKKTLISHTFWTKLQIAVTLRVFEVGCSDFTGSQVHLDILVSLCYFGIDLLQATYW